MNIMVNGEPREIAESVSLEALIQQLGYGDRPVAVAMNDDFITKAQRATTVIRAGDRLDIVAPMSGG